MIAFMIGDENKAEPKPRILRLAKMKARALLLINRIKSINPTAVRPIPKEAITRGSILSESRPANGEKIAIITGVEMRTKPAY